MKAHFTSLMYFWFLFQIQYDLLHDYIQLGFD